MGISAAHVAQGAAPGSEPGFTLAPYGWLAGLDGTLGAPVDDGDGGGGDPIDVVLDPDYELKGFMLYGEWRGERWMAFVDGVWANYKQGGRISVGNGLVGTEADGEVDGYIWTAGAGYPIAETEDSLLILYGGLRYYDLEVTVSSRNTLPALSFEGTASGTWTDALLGLQWKYRLYRNWQGIVQADYGFGESDSSWSVAATLGYGFSWGRVMGGWRHLDVDYESGSYTADLALTGPAIGVVFDF